MGDVRGDLAGIGKLRNGGFGFDRTEDGVVAPGAEGLDQECHHAIAGADGVNLAWRKGRLLVDESLQVGKT